jgi:hypothetical protein
MGIDTSREAIRLPAKSGGSRSPRRVAIAFFLSPLLGGVVVALLSGLGYGAFYASQQGESGDAWLSALLLRVLAAFVPALGFAGLLTLTVALPIFLFYEKNGWRLPTGRGRIGFDHPVATGALLGVAVALLPRLALLALGLVPFGPVSLSRALWEAAWVVSAAVCGASSGICFRWLLR